MASRSKGYVRPKSPTKKKANGETSRLVAEALAANWPRMLLATALMGTALAANVGYPLFFRMAIDTAIPARNVRLLSWLVAGMILIPASEVLISAFRNRERALLGAEIAQALREPVFDRVIRMTLTSLERINTSDVLYRITRSCGELGLFVSNQLIPFVYNLLLFLAYLAVMFILDRFLAGFTLLVLPLLFLLSSFVGGKTQRLEQSFQQLLERGERFVAEVLRGLRTVKAFCGESRERAVWHGWIGEHRRAQAKTFLFHELFRFGLPQLVSSLGWGLVLSVGAYRVVSGRTTVGNLVAFLAYVPSAYVALRTVLDFRVAGAAIKASTDRIDGLLSMETEDRSFGTVVLARSPCGSKVEFTNVSFGYGRGDFALKGVSFRVEGGSFLGIVGPTGGGKSTIIDLILGFYQPDSGTIEIDGHEVRSLSIESLRNRIGMVSQDVFLHNATIRENICYPWTDVDESDLARAAEIAQLRDWVARLPAGYDTTIGEAGMTLSGGERQRIAIARAVLKDPELLLFDEATSALDALTEDSLRVALQAARQNRTLIAVAHRFQTIISADKILVIDRGNLEESGTLQELLQAGGLFSQMYAAHSLAKPGPA